MTDILTLKKFESLGPFEIKNELIDLAKKTSRTTQLAFLNAGRGNPNWIATTPREGFFLLGQFAEYLSKVSPQLDVQCLSPAFGNENNVVFTLPLAVI